MFKKLKRISAMSIETPIKYTNTKAKFQKWKQYVQYKNYSYYVNVKEILQEKMFSEVEGSKRNCPGEQERLKGTQ